MSKREKEKDEESKMYAKTFANQLWYVFESEEAKQHGFTPERHGANYVKFYKDWKEKAERRRNLFKGYYVGEGDQKLISQWVIAAGKRTERKYRNALGKHTVLPAIEETLVNYGYGFSDKAHHRFWQYKPRLKMFVYSSSGQREPTPVELKRVPIGERDFPSGNLDVDVSVVKEMLGRKGLAYNPLKDVWRNTAAPKKWVNRAFKFKVGKRRR